MPETLLPKRDEPISFAIDSRNDRQGAPAGPEESPLKPALDALLLFRRHWLLIALGGAAGFGLTQFLLRKQAPLYQATAVIRYSDKTRGLSGQLGSNPNDRARTTADPLLTQVQLLKSRTVAQAVAQRAGLRLQTATPRTSTDWLRDVVVADSAPNGVIHLTFLPSSATVHSGSAAQTVRYGDPITIRGVSFVVSHPAPEGEATLNVVPLAQAAGQVLGGLDGRPRERTDIIDVSYTSPDPAAAQRVVNAAAEAYQELNAATAKQESARRREFINQQLRKTDSAMLSAQATYDAFRSQNRVFSSQDKFKSQQSDLASIDIRRQELAADRRMYASLLSSLTDARENPTVAGERLNALLSSPGIAQNPVVSQVYGQLLKYQAARDSLALGRWASAPTNPDVRRLDTLIATTQSKLLAAVRGEVASVDARISALDSLRSNASRGLAGLPEAESREANLLAQLEIYRRESDRLREELQKAQIEEAAEGGQVDIVDLAPAPGVMIGTGKTQRLALATLLGLLAGAGIAYILENKDSVVRRREDLERLFRAPNLVLVPRIMHGSPMTASRGLLSRFNGKSHNGVPAAVNGKELVTITDGRSSGAEAYRTLRTNLLFSATGAALRRLVITSPGPQEGKSTTIANLAVAFAQQGRKTVLIDCDLRRPRLHKIFPQSQRPGISEVLSGQIDLASVVLPTAVPNLFLITAGPQPPNPAELLGAPAMRSVLDTLGATFDLVLIDSPPVLAASDAAILARVTDGVVVVVRAGATERGAIAETVQQLANVGARILGTVLNDPDAEVQRYAGYYGYYYNNYYGYSEQST